jgi:NADPH:quinone reductase-like Zn-dependent oxidoreductase
VGHFACQLAHLVGAHVVALIRREETAELVRAAHADDIVISEDVEEARQFGPYRLIVESVGGQVLAKALSMLASDGLCVSFGASSGAEVTFDLTNLMRARRASLYGLLLFNEFRREPAAVGLTRLASLVADQRLRPHIALEAPWTEIGSVARQLLDRRISGKAVLHT